MPVFSKYLGEEKNCNILIIGAGLAGLFLALKLTPRSCTILSPAPIGKASASGWAQGGIAAVFHPQDSVLSHVNDTLKAGIGLSDPAIARIIAQEGPERIEDLLALNIPFNRDINGKLSLSLEAAHTHPRIVGVSGDKAGKAIMEILSQQIQKLDNVDIIENVQAYLFLQDKNGRINGVLAHDTQGRNLKLNASIVIACMGGVGALYTVTTNPDQARGHALAMAYNAGATIMDPEFLQFHPTAIDINQSPAPLATEALRGAGALLVNTDGKRFMPGYHDKAELAPRDIVARAVHQERNQGRGAYLDARHNIGKCFKNQFPTVYTSLKNANINPASDLIPVAPAAHYHMGGILSDIWGRASLEGLYVCGECAATGVHGANRLASNSLLETLVFAARIAKHIHAQDTRPIWPAERIGTERDIPADLQPAPISKSAIRALRQTMLTHCGVLRQKEGLRIALDTLEPALSKPAPALEYITASLILRAALAREESLGAHYRQDYPNSKVSANHSIISRYHE